MVARRGHWPSRRPSVEQLPMSVLTCALQASGEAANLPLEYPDYSPTGEQLPLEMLRVFDKPKRDAPATSHAPNAPSRLRQNHAKEPREKSSKICSIQ